MNFDYVYEKYFKDVYVFILSLTSNQETAQEITQETFFKALKAIDRFDGSKDILAWLFTIARNTYYTHLKKQSKISDVPQDENRVLNEEISIEEKLINEEDAFLIHEFIHTMKEPYKKCSICEFLENYPLRKQENFLVKVPDGQGSHITGQKSRYRNIWR